ncbi:hypothetical protein D623_10004118 [Myotis brandtii]|uniref:Uncharacterized protein n=1 Tax=Myotis brandtii TaxID=109478 RepID=S7PD07_MYOBR|nr:hypothetical protein D623_10004118 [Myotis brandtii]
MLTGQNAETVGRKLKSIAKASEHGLQSPAGRLQTGGPLSEAGDPRPRSSEAAVPSGWFPSGKQLISFACLLQSPVKSLSPQNI